MLICLQKCGYFTKISFCRKIQQKLKSQQKLEETVYSRIEVATENRGRDRKLSCQSVPSHDITKFSFEEEIEALNK